MQNADLSMFLAVFQEMLGIWLWVLPALIVLGFIALVVLLLRERRVVSRRLLQSELLGIAGGGLALVIMAKVSSSGFTDAGGPADWFLIAVVYGIGLILSTVLCYTALGWWQQRL